jgi:hypothetical protein
LTLHAVKHDVLNISSSHRCGEKKRVNCCKLPIAKPFPHGVHRSRAQGNKIWECVVEEEHLMVLAVVGTV